MQRVMMEVHPIEANFLRQVRRWRFGIVKEIKIEDGLPMLAEAARRTGGGPVLASCPGEGTTVSASFGLRHIDRQPLGDLAGSLVTLIAGNPAVDVLYEHRRDGRAYRLDTQEIKEALGNVSITHVPVLQFLRENLEAGRREIGSTA